MADGTIKIGMELDGSRLGAQADAAGKDAANKAGASFSEVESKGTSVFSTVAKVGAAAFAAIGSAALAFGGMALSAYSNYEQLSGGVAKLYGSGQTLVAYAQEQGKAVAEVRDEYNSLNPAVALMSENASKAWQTAGMSANQYMEQATSFSAALINSLGGDTVKAAQQTDVAMRAMSDNVNTFGSNMTDVQNAFQGFAKQNYTMLDNLKLGYGGTKEEMQRLIDDANAYAAANGQAADLSIDSFSDIVTAIELIQEKQGIAGTTAREGATTIEGSINEVKAAWENLVAGIGSPDADMTALIDNLMTALGDVATNVAPAAQRIGEGIVNALPGALAGIQEKLAPVLSEALAGAWNAATAVFAQLGINIPTIDASQVQSAIDGLVSAFQQLSDVLGPIVTGVIQFLVDALGFLAENGQTLLPVIAAVAAAFMAWQAVTEILKLVTAAQAALNMVMAANPAAIVIVLIVALVAALITLWNTNEGFRNAVIAAWTVISTTAAAVWGAIVGFFTVTVPGAIQALIGFFASMPGSIAGFLGSVIGNVASFVGSVVSGAASAGSGFLNNIVSFIGSVPGRVAGFLGDVIGNVGSFVGQMASNAISAASQFASNLISGLSSIPGQVVSIGSNIVEGIANGIRNAGGAILDALGGAINGAINTVKGWLGIHSPSTLMRDLIGVNIGRGAAIGVSLGWDMEDPFGSLRKDVKLGIDGVQMDFKQQGAVFGFVSDKGQQPPKVEQHFETKVVRSDDDLYSAAAILHRNALSEAMGVF
jgi:phage-related protein